MPSQNLNMLTTAQSAEIFNRILSACTFPGTTELEDHKCHICQEESLGNGTEKATKLDCGHILGMACLMKWTLQKVNEGSVAIPCPFCRMPFLTSPAMTSQRDISERDELDIWVENLARWSPGEPESMSNLAISRIKRAEELWDRLCSTILDSIDRSIAPSEHGFTSQIENLLCGTTFVAQRILSFGNVYNFQVAYVAQGFRLDSTFHEYLGSCLAPYQELIAHLRTMGAPDEDWRVYQAFQSPSGQLVEYRRRLEDCRFRLSQQIEEARAAARR